MRSGQSFSIEQAGQAKADRRGPHHQIFGFRSVVRGRERVPGPVYRSSVTRRSPSLNRPFNTGGGFTTLCAFVWIGDNSSDCTGVALRNVREGEYFRERVPHNSGRYWNSPSLDWPQSFGILMKILNKEQVVAYKLVLNQSFLF